MSGSTWVDGGMRFRKGGMGMGVGVGGEGEGEWGILRTHESAVRAVRDIVDQEWDRYIRVRCDSTTL